MRYNPRHAVVNAVKRLPVWARITAPVVTVLALASGGAMYAAGAGAATNACGAHCIDISFLSTGHRWLLNDSKGRTTPNAVVSQQLGSNGGNQGRNEDFEAFDEGTVQGTYCPSATNQPAIDPLFTPNQCALIKNAGLIADTAYQAEYVPDGADASGLCVGTWDGTNPLPSASSWLTRLQPCGENANTVVIIANKLPAGTADPGSFWAVSGASNNFSNPEVLGNDGIQRWENLRWQPIAINGGTGVVNQEIRVQPGAY